MSLLSLRKNPKSFADYEAFVAGKPEEERWELLDGEIYLQASPVDVHQDVLGNLMEHLRPAARRLGPECRAINGINVKVDHVGTYAPIPDLIVRCGPLRGTNRCSDPIVIVEVLSPSTAEPRVEVWERDGAQWRFRAFTHGGDRVPLPALSTAISLADIYAGTNILSR